MDSSTANLISFRELKRMRLAAAYQKSLVSNTIIYNKSHANIYNSYKQNAKIFSANQTNASNTELIMASGDHLQPELPKQEMEKAIVMSASTQTKCNSKASTTNIIASAKSCQQEVKRKLTTSGMSKSHSTLTESSGKSTERRHCPAAEAIKPSARGGTMRRPATAATVSTAAAKASTAPASIINSNNANTSNKQQRKLDNSRSSNKRSFNAYAATAKSFISKGPSACHANSSNKFVYHLSASERRDYGKSQVPMKKVPSSERKLINDGHRQIYLNKRNEREPPTKYNFPEATSWRIGWFANSQDSNSNNNNNKIINSTG